MVIFVVAAAAGLNDLTCEFLHSRLKIDDVQFGDPYWATMPPKNPILSRCNLRRPLRGIWGIRQERSISSVIRCKTLYLAWFFAIFEIMGGNLLYSARSYYLWGKNSNFTFGRVKYYVQVLVFHNLFS